MITQNKATNIFYWMSLEVVRAPIIILKIRD